MWNLYGACVSEVGVCETVAMLWRPREQSSGIRRSSCTKAKSEPERAYLWNKTTAQSAKCKDVLLNELCLILHFCWKELPTMNCNFLGSYKTEALLLHAIPQLFLLVSFQFSAVSQLIKARQATK